MDYVILEGNQTNQIISGIHGRKGDSGSKVPVSDSRNWTSFEDTWDCSIDFYKGKL